MAYGPFKLGTISSFTLHFPKLLTLTPHMNLFLEVPNPEGQAK